MGEYTNVAKQLFLLTAADCQPVLVFLPCSHSAPDMATAPAGRQGLKLVNFLHQMDITAYWMKASWMAATARSASALSMITLILISLVEIIWMLMFWL